MRALSRKARTVLGRLWWWLRQVSGDAAYENYLRQITTSGASVESAKPAPRPFQTAPGAALLSPREFYGQQLARRYRGVTRCC